MALGPCQCCSSSSAVPKSSRRKRVQPGARRAHHASLAQQAVTGPRRPGPARPGLWLPVASLGAPPTPRPRLSGVWSRQSWLPACPWPPSWVQAVLGCPAKRALRQGAPLLVFLTPRRSPVSGAVWGGEPAWPGPCTCLPADLGHSRRLAMPFCPLTPQVRPPSPTALLLVGTAALRGSCPSSCLLPEAWGVPQSGRTGPRRRRLQLPAARARASLCLAAAHRSPRPFPCPLPWPGRAPPSLLPEAIVSLISGAAENRLSSAKCNKGASAAPGQTPALRRGSGPPSRPEAPAPRPGEAGRGQASKRPSWGWGLWNRRAGTAVRTPGQTEPRTGRVGAGGREPSEGRSEPTPLGAPVGLWAAECPPSPPGASAPAPPPPPGGDHGHHSALGVGATGYHV